MLLRIYRQAWGTSRGKALLQVSSQTQYQDVSFKGDEPKPDCGPVIGVVDAHHGCVWEQSLLCSCCGFYREQASEIAVLAILLLPEVLQWRTRSSANQKEPVEPRREPCGRQPKTRPRLFRMQGRASGRVLGAAVMVRCRCCGVCGRCRRCAVGGAV